MKILKKCPILVGIVVITIALSIVSFIFKDTVYAGYADKYESGDIPLLALALKGATDEVFPWSDTSQEALLPQDVQPDEPDNASQQEETATDAETQGDQSEPEEVAYISGDDV